MKGLLFLSLSKKRRGLAYIILLQDILQSSVAPGFAPLSLEAGFAGSILAFFAPIF